MKNHTLAKLSALSFIAAAGLLSTGCSDVGQSGDDITDIANTSVKNQSIGNCWIYASIGWAESLRLTHSGEALNLSESYVTYWHWFDQIHGGVNGQRPLGRLDNKEGVSELATGGWWSVAVELMRRYGMVDEGVFLPTEAEDARSSRQSSAKSAINKSLKEGVLSDPEKRRDAAIVRAELDKAWGLDENVVSLLNTVFGEGVERTLYDNPMIPEDSGLRTPSSLEVGHDGNGKALTLADAIGEPTYAWWGAPPERVGPYAWNEVDYPTSSTSSRRKFQINVQDALHRRLPAIMTWYVDFNALENDNTFKKVPDTVGRQGGHMTVLEDYEIENVPEYGTLEAGVTVTDPAVLEAALDPSAKISFFRIKNSWGLGLSPEPDQGDELKGYYDLWMDYLDARIPTENGASPGLSGVVLPPSTFQSGGGAPEEPENPTGACAHDLCETGSVLDASCDPCAAKIIEADPFCGETSWDDVCVEQVASVCEQVCE